VFRPEGFVEKFQLARQTALETRPPGGLCGLELEWKLVDPQFRRCFTVGTGPDHMSFRRPPADKVLSPWMEEYHQLEVFHWMIGGSNAAYQRQGCVYEGACWRPPHQRPGQGRTQLREPLHYWHGKLLVCPRSPDCVPESWHLAKRATSSVA